MDINVNPPTPTPPPPINQPIKQSIPQSSSTQISYASQSNHYPLFSKKILYFIIGGAILAIIPFIAFSIASLIKKNPQPQTPTQTTPTESFVPSITPIPTIDVTFDWLLYTSNSGRYSLKYPPTYKLNQTTSTNTIELIASPSPVFKLQITHKGASNVVSIDDYVKEQGYCVSTFESLPTVLGGLESSLFKDTTCNNTNLSAIISYNKPYVYDLLVTSDEKYSAIQFALNQILSTFTFFPDSSPATASSVLSASISEQDLEDWVEYKDSKYAFRFKHPPDWLTNVVDFKEEGTRLINLAKKTTPTTYNISFMIKNDWENLGFVQYEENNFEVGGLEAYKADPPTKEEQKLDQYITNVYFQNGGKPYIFACVHNWDEKYLDTCTKVISSVKLGVN